MAGKDKREVVHSAPTKRLLIGSLNWHLVPVAAL